jgi:hypothetical protein
MNIMYLNRFIRVLKKKRENIGGDKISSIMDIQPQISSSRIASKIYG